MAPKPKQPWTKAEKARRDKILKAAEVRGILHKQLAAAAGLSGNSGQIKFHRWTKGEANLTEEQWLALERASSGVGLPVEDKSSDATAAQLTEVELAAALGELEHVAGRAPEDEKEPFRFLVQKHTSAIVGQALRLMVGAKSESVRARMVEFLKETAWGKAVQAYVDQTPKPPAEDSEFLESLSRLVANARGEGERGVTAVELARTTGKATKPEQEAEASGAPAANQLAH
jgi:hypothetical protein